MSNTSGMEHPGTGPDTGDIPPGESREITFSEPGTVPIHCHPHPFMMHNVTVTRGPAAATHVHIVDGARASDFGFQPENITVGGGSVVTYHNHGTQTHTATRRPDA